MERKFTRKKSLYIDTYIEHIDLDRKHRERHLELLFVRMEITNLKTLNAICIEVSQSRQLFPK